MSVRKRILLFLGVVLVAGIGILLFIYTQTLPPSQWQGEKVFEVTSGMTVRDITSSAKENNLVRSPLLLHAILKYRYNPNNIYAGSYYFEKPESVFKVAKKFAYNNITQNLTRLTIPEGLDVQSIAQTIAKTLTEFDADVYITIAQEKEGYLFPDTYFIPNNFSPEELLQLQLTTYRQNIAPLKDTIENNPLSEYEALILASILEREANDEKSMKMVSGILQNRLSMGIPLQADATVAYALETPLNELPEGLLAEKLRTTQSPYNTYLNTGLPPTPIGNPGITAIKAVLDPTDTPYLYYLTAPDGTFYYARTYAEHLQNIAKYLR